MMFNNVDAGASTRSGALEYVAGEESRISMFGPHRAPRLARYTVHYQQAEKALSDISACVCNSRSRIPGEAELAGMR